MTCECMGWWENSFFTCCFQCCRTWPNTQPVHRVWWGVWRHRPPRGPVHSSLQLWRYVWVRHVLDLSGNGYFCSCGLCFYFFQAAVRAPYQSQRESSWASWRKTKEMDGWGSWKAVVKRALYRHLMSVVIVKTVCHAFLSFWLSLNQRRETKAINHSARDSGRLPRSISIVWSLWMCNICWRI